MTTKLQEVAQLIYDIDNYDDLIDIKKLIELKMKKIIKHQIEDKIAFLNDKTATPKQRRERQREARREHCERLERDIERAKLRLVELERAGPIQFT